MAEATRRAPRHLLRLAVGILLGGGLLAACSGSESVSRTETTGADDARVYHVRLDLTEDKDRAAQILGQAVQWWKKQPSSARPPLAREDASSRSAASIRWKAPFYRVQLGPFATRPQAEAVLQAAQSRFPDAFVAPERIDAE